MVGRGWKLAYGNLLNVAQSYKRRGGGEGKIGLISEETRHKDKECLIFYFFSSEFLLHFSMFFFSFSFFSWPSFLISFYTSYWLFLLPLSSSSSISLNSRSITCPSSFSSFYSSFLFSFFLILRSLLIPVFFFLFIYFSLFSFFGIKMFLISFRHLLPLYSFGSSYSLLLTKIIKFFLVRPLFSSLLSPPQVLSMQILKLASILVDSHQRKKCLGKL